MDEGPRLKLIMEKGPREGETLEFKPGSEIRIGRVVRGNNVPIKEAGISSQHLSIQFKSASNSGQWVISDLNSSNGTLLNKSPLSPMVPTVLSHGDTIKIGEYTSITVNIIQVVQIVGDDENSDDNNKVRRNPRRRATAKNDTMRLSVETRSRRGRGKVNLGGENSELGLGNDRRGALKEDRVSKNEVEQSEIEIGKVGEMENVRLVKEKQMRKVSTRKARTSTKDDDLSMSTVLKSGVQESEIEAVKVEEMEIVGPIDTQQTQKMDTRRTKSSMNDEGLSIDRFVKSGVENSEIGVENSEGKDNVHHVEAKQAWQVITRRTRSSKEEENLSVDVNVCRELRNLIGVDSKKAGRRGKKGSKNLHDEASESIQDGVVEEEGVLEELNLRREGENFQANLPNGAMEAGQVEVENKSGVEVDIEKLTLGEWFDYLEVYLPKQIHDKTEELISAMERKAEQFYEFMLQQKNAKEKEMPMG